MKVEEIPKLAAVQERAQMKLLKIFRRESDTEKCPEPRPKRYQFSVPDNQCEPLHRNGLMDPAPLHEPTTFTVWQIIGISILAACVFFGLLALAKYNDREQEKMRKEHPELFRLPE